MALCWRGSDRGAQRSVACLNDVLVSVTLNESVVGHGDLLAKFSYGHFTAYYEIGSPWVSDMCPWHPEDQEWPNHRLFRLIWVSSSMFLVTKAHPPARSDTGHLYPAVPRFWSQRNLWFRTCTRKKQQSKWKSFPYWGLGKVGLRAFACSMVAITGHSTQSVGGQPR